VSAADGPPGERPGDPATDQWAPPARESPDVRVVVVTYSPGKHLDDFLESLADATKRPYEVIMADNGSTDGAPEAAAERGAARLLRTGGNLGYGTAANRAASGATADWLVVANPDIVWTAGALDELLDAAARWPNAGALGPAIRTPQGDLYPSARDLPSLRRGIGHALLGWWWPRNPWTAAYRRERDDPTEGATGWLSGSCLVLRRVAFETVHGFDEGYFMFSEDLDLCERLGRAGWLSVYVPSAVVSHVGGHSWRRAPARMLYHHHRSTYRYLARRYRGPAYLPLRVILFVGLAVRFALSLVIRRVAEGAAPARSADVLAEAGH
jgi:N-acetylglucosaminyl-diphospho-decaprenol L-rhamnosyltransferase